MAGLLDMGDEGDLASAGFLRGLLGASQQRKRPFTMLLGGLAGLQQAQAMAAQQAQDRALAERKLAIEEALKNAQIANFQSEAEQRKAAIEKQARLEAMASSLLGGSTVGNGVAGQGLSLGGVQEKFRPAGLEGARLNDIAAFQLAGGPNLLEHYKVAQAGVEQKPGFSVRDGVSTFTPTVDKNITMNGGRASLIPGITEALAAQTRATKGAEAEFTPVNTYRGGQPGVERLSDVLGTSPRMPSDLSPVNGRVPQNEKQAAQDLTDFANNAINARTNIGGRGFTPTGPSEIDKARAAGANTTNTSFMEQVSKRHDTLQATQAALDNIDRAKLLVPQAINFTGSLGEKKLAVAKLLNNNLGLSIDTKGVQAAETLRTSLFQQIMDNLKKLDASPSQEQQRTLQKALGSLDTDPSALPAVLDSFGDILKSKVSIHNNQVKEATGRGMQFPFDPTIKIKSPIVRTGVRADGTRVVQRADGSIDDGN